MDIEFDKPEYDRLETDSSFDNGFATNIVRAYRKRLNELRSALDERQFYAMKSWRFEKLKGDRQHQRSIRLNDQFRLILELIEVDDKKLLKIIGIEDYH